MPWTDDFNTISKYQGFYGCRYKVVSVDKCIRQQFFENNSGDFWLANGIDTLSILHMSNICQQETQCLGENIREFPHLGLGCRYNGLLLFVFLQKTLI